MSIKSKAKKLIKEVTGHISFGDMIHSCRLAEEFSQVDYAKMLKISKQELCNIEKGRKLVSVERAVNFAKLIDMSEKVFAKYALQDQLVKAGVEGEVNIDVA